MRAAHACTGAGLSSIRLTRSGWWGSGPAGHHRYGGCHPLL